MIAEKKLSIPQRIGVLKLSREIGHDEESDRNLADSTCALPPDACVWVIAHESSITLTFQFQSVCG